MEENNNIEVIRRELLRLRENPADLVPDSDKDRFRGYCDRWHEQKKIGEVWYETEALFFPLFFRDSFSQKLRKICVENFDFYMEVLSSIGVPYVLYDILTMQISAEGGWGVVLKVLKLSAICKTQDGILGDDIDSVLAPVALDVLTSHILYQEEPSSEAAKGMEQISEAIRNRADGFYLCYHYVKYLLWKDPGKESFYDFLEIFSDGFEDEAKKYFIADGKVNVEGLGGLSDNAAGDFTSTGILNTVEGTDALLNFRTLLRFIKGDGQEEQLWDAFKMVYSCNSQSFFTNDFDFHLKHFDICNLILSRKDVIEAWKEINKMAQGSLHRLSFQYYEDQSMGLRSHIEFMWAVNLQMLDYLCREDKELASAMWNEFWTGGLAYARRFAKYQVDFVYQYLCRLISYYFVCFVRRKHSAEEKGTGEKCVDMEELMPKFKEIGNMPILVLMSVSMLLSNGLTWQDIMGGKYGNFFAELFHRAGELAVGQNKYEWVFLYLKKIRFVYKGDNKAGINNDERFPKEELQNEICQSNI